MSLADYDPRQRDCTVFTVRVEHNVYRAPVSAEALYMLCRDHDPSLDRLDAYLLLKQKVQTAVERIVGDRQDVPGLLEPAHFMHKIDL